MTISPIQFGCFVGTLAWLGAGPLLAADLKEALIFHASFDRAAEADFALGDKRLYHAPTLEKLGETKEGLPASGVTREEGQGLRGGAALRFHQRSAPVIFFRGEKNTAYQSQQWQGTASLWLRVDPIKELGPGYSDPLQITTRQWNDGAFFVDFAKDGDPREFRLGLYADLAVWNPSKRDFATLGPSEIPLLPVKNPPFGADKWTHVCFTWEHFNSGKKDGLATFYLDGQAQGQLKDWNQTFTWKAEEKQRIFLGISYVGLLDEVALFKRPLSGDEVAALFAAKGKIGG